MNVIRVGLSGGIGAGKSTVGKTFIERGAYHIDADRIAREVVEPGTPALNALVEAFGPDILADDGSLDRAALAAKAFADEEQRQKLNAITHPAVWARTQELLSAAPADAIVVQDIPLLVEGNMAPFFHLVIIVGADEELRIKRLTELRGMPEDDARVRIRAQASDEQRRAAADVWLDNSGAPDVVAAAAAGLWDTRLVAFEENVRTRTVAHTDLELVDHQPDWGSAGQRVVNRLWAIVGGQASAIDHVGSTSVPGLIAKPVIDIQLTVADMVVADELCDILANGGFPRLTSTASDDPRGAGGDESLWAKRFHGSADPGRPVNIHLRADGAPNQRFALAFRDWLRGDATARDEYAAVKQAALAGADGDRARYAAAKDPFFDRAFARLMS